MKKSVFFLLLFSVTGGGIFAQQKVSLTLYEAQAYALEHNRTLMNASLDIKSAEATRWKSIATMLPQASASFDYSNFCGFEMNFGAMSIPMNPSGSLTAKASVAVNGVMVVNTQLSKIALDMAQVTQQKTEQEIANQVKSMYYSILTMEKTDSLLAMNLNNLRKLHQFTENSVKVGIAEQTDADKLLVQVAEMETSVNSTQRSLEILYNSLRLQLGLSADTEIELTQTIDNLLNPEAALKVLTVDFDLNNNYSYTLLKQATKLSEKQVTLNAWNYGPTLSAFYQYTKKTYFGKEEGFSNTPPNLVGFSLSLPIFSSGVNYSKLVESKIAYKKQLNTFTDTEESLRINHRQLRYNLSSAYESFETQRKNIEVSQRLFDNTMRKYEKGVASSLEVTSSATSLIVAQNSYVQALMGFVSAQIALEQLLNVNNTTKNN